MTDSWKGAPEPSYLAGNAGLARADGLLAEQIGAVGKAVSSHHRSRKRLSKGSSIHSSPGSEQFDQMSTVILNRS